MGERKEKEDDSRIEELIEKLIDREKPVELKIARKAVEAYKISPSTVSSISDWGKSIRIIRKDGNWSTVPKASLDEEKPTETGTDELPDPLKMKIEPLTPEQREEEEKKLEERRKWGKQVAEKLLPLIEELLWIESQENWEASPELRKRHDQLKKLIEKYYTADLGVRKLVEINLYTAKIRALAKKIREAIASDASLNEKEIAKENKLYEEGLKLNRLTELTGKEVKDKAHILYGKFTKRKFGFTQEPGKRVEGKNEANAAIEITFRDLYKAIKEHRENAVSRIKNEATPGLTLLRVARGNQTPGKILGYLPGYEERSEVYFLVEFDGQMIRPLEATGRVQRFFIELVAEGTHITRRSLMETLVNPERSAKLRLEVRLPEEKFKTVLNLLRILKAAVMYEMKTEKPAEAETPAETEKLESAVKKKEPKAPKGN